MSRRCLVLVSVVAPVLLLSLLVAGCGGSPDGQALVESRCITCHNLTSVRVAVKSEEEWQETVERMVALGARLNKAQQTAVVSYLASEGED